MSFQGKRAVVELKSYIPGKPESVFPLLCPVREYEWIDGWQCEMVYSESGVAEDNCIFKTPVADHTMTWSVSRYEPPYRIEFVAVVPEQFVMRLNVVLDGVSNGTNLHWTRMFTGLSETGNGTVEKLAAEGRDKLVKLNQRLEHFVKTGSMLREA